MIELQNNEESRRYIVGAQTLVDEARGSLGERGWRMANNEVASYDDISVFVIPLCQWRNSLEIVLENHRNRRQSVRASSTGDTISTEEFCHLSPVLLETVGDKLSTKQIADVTKSYEDIKNVEIEGLKQAKDELEAL